MSSAHAVTPDDDKAAGNPFQSIVERNVFGIKPPPPPSEEKLPEPPPAIPPAKVVLTGILNILGPPRALLEVAEAEPGKQPNTKKPILREGERDGAIEVLSIDIAKNVVRIRNGNLETNLTFEALKQSTGPAMAALPPPPAFNMPSVGANTGAILPTTTSASTSTSSGGRRSIVLAGAETQPATAFGGNSGNPGMLAMGNSGYARQPRMAPTPVEQQKPVDPATQWLEMKAHEQAAKGKNIPFPPVPPVFNMDGDTGAGGPPPPPTGGRPPGLPPFPPPPSIPLPQ
jgi:hypothetical protein